MTRDVSKYLIKNTSSIPWGYRLRDISLTLLAWFFWGAICLDVVHLAHFEFFPDSQPLPYAPVDYQAAGLDWDFIAEQLSRAYRIGRALIFFLLVSLLINIVYYLKTANLNAAEAEPLSLQEEVTAYDCEAGDVSGWRGEQIVTAWIDDQGQVERVRKGNRLNEPGL
jgi:hypothetical protein